MSPFLCNFVNFVIRLPALVKIIWSSFLSLQQNNICVAYRNFYFINEKKQLLQSFHKHRGDKEAKHLLLPWLSKHRKLYRQNWAFPSHHVLTALIPAPLSARTAGEWCMMVSNHQLVPHSLTYLHSVLCEEMAELWKSVQIHIQRCVWNRPTQLRADGAVGFYLDGRV